MVTVKIMFREYYKYRHFKTLKDAENYIKEQGYNERQYKIIDGYVE